MDVYDMKDCFEIDKGDIVSGFNDFVGRKTKQVIPKTFLDDVLGAMNG